MYEECLCNVFRTIKEVNLGIKKWEVWGKFWRDLRSLSVVYYKFYYNMIYYLGGLLSVV